MAILDKQIAIIKHQLAGLETSQRVALGLCAVVIAGSILWLTQWSMQSEMVPLHTQKLSAEELDDISRQLRIMGEDFKERGDGIYVKPDDRRRLLMALVERDAGPKDFSVTFESLIKNSNVFASEKSTQWQQNVALQNELAKTILTSPKIKDASVYINPELRGKLGKPSSKSTASVQVRMASGVRIDGGVVESLAALVSGAVPSLEPQNVSVIDQATMRTYAVDDPEDEYGKKLYDLQRQKEMELRTKIEGLLSYIPGVIVSVSVKLEEESRDMVETVLDKPELIKEIEEEETQNNQATAVEPGVSANMSAALSNGGTGNSKTKTKKDIEYSERRGQKTTKTRKKPGMLLEANASINVPRSYFEGAQKSLSEDSDEALASKLQDFIEEQKQAIKKQVEPLLRVAEKEPMVEVSEFSDAAVAYIAPPASTEPAEASSVMDFVSTNLKQLGLAGLALMALVMMVHTVRKSSSVALPTDLESQMEVAGPLGELRVDSGAIGEAGSPDAILIARETDEDSVRARQVAQQVTDLINDDPENAAQLVRRWIDRDL